MSSILIKTNNKENDSLLLQLAKAMKMPIRILSEDDEQDLLLIQSIDKGAKTGKASKEEVNKVFAKNGIRIH
jgi:hypothetical protein